MTPDERSDLADLNRDLTALEAAARGWASYKWLRDGTDNVLPLTPQDRAELDAVLKEIM